MVIAYLVLFVAVVFIIAAFTGQVDKLSEKGSILLGFVGFLWVGLVVYQQIRIIMAG